MKAAVRILLADDHELIRKGLRTLLQAHAGWEVCGEAANGRETLDLARQFEPHVVIMDLTMPVLNGLEATRRLRQMLPRCEVLILTMHDSEQLMHEVLQAGARGFLLKSDAGNLIVSAVEAVSRHQPFFTAQVSSLLLRSHLAPSRAASLPAREGAGGLTQREREIVQRIAEGRSSKEIAAELGLSDKTVETHRANLMRKLGIHSASEVVRYAIRNRMVEA
jgi:DNA-binding NarL/FixJ family response regulator